MTGRAAVDGRGSVRRAQLRALAWFRTLLAPRAHLLPAVGVRLGRRRRLAVGVLLALRALPGGRLRAFAYRNVSGPLCERLDVELEVPVVDGDLHMIVNTSEPIGRTLAASGTWEPGVTALFRRLLRTGDVCVDVGANIGYFTLLAARLVGPTGHVYALEPEPRLYRDLVANVALNRAANVSALPEAAGAAAGAAALHTGGRGRLGQSSLRRPGNGWRTVDVAVRPVHGLLGPSELQRLRLIKIDVEGFEVEVLRGLAPILERGIRPALVVELHPLLDPGGLTYVADMAGRYGLQVHRLLDDHGSRRDVPRGIALPFERVPTDELPQIVDSHPTLVFTPRDSSWAAVLR